MQLYTNSEKRPGAEAMYQKTDALIFRDDFTVVFTLRRRVQLVTGVKKNMFTPLATGWSLPAYFVFKLYTKSGLYTK